MTPTRKHSQGWLMVITALCLLLSSLACQIGGMNLPIPDLFGPAATPTTAATATLAATPTKAGCTLPSLTGKDQSIAEAAIGVLGLEVNVTEKYNPAVDKGVVITQSPVAGTELAPCEGTIELVVSKGAPEATPTTVATATPVVEITSVPVEGDQPMYDLQYYEGFEDRIDGFDSYWDTYVTDGSTVETSDGDLVVTGSMQAFTTDETWADYIFTVYDVLASGDSTTLSMYFRIVDETHYYRLDCATTSTGSLDCSFKIAVDSWEDIVPGSKEIKNVCPGVCDISVEAKGSEYRLLIDGDEVGSFEDDSYLEGGIGLGVDSNGTVMISAMDLIEPDKAASAGSPLMVDEFDTNTWPVEPMDTDYDTVEREIADGVYHWDIEAKKGVSFKQLLTTDYVLPDTFTYVAELTHTDGTEDGGYGILFHMQDYNNFYYFNLRDSGTIELYAMENSEWIELQAPTDFEDISLDDYNEIAVVANGSHYVFYVNGYEALDYTDDRFTGGTIGLGIDLYDTGDTISVDFDNLQVWVP